MLNRLACAMRQPSVINLLISYSGIAEENARNRRSDMLNSGVTEVVTVIQNMAIGRGVNKDPL